MSATLSPSEIEHLRALERRLDRPLRERLREAGCDCDGPPQVSAAVNNYRKPQRSYAAPQWSGEGIPGVVHDSEGHVYFASPEGRRRYHRAHGTADMRDFNV